MTAQSAPLVFALGATAPLGDRVCAALGLARAPHEERTFEDGEHKLRPLANVRNRDVYVLHSLDGDGDQTADDKLCRLLFFVATLKDAAAARVTAVAPYLCYGRKDRQTKPRDPLTSRYVAQLFEAMGTDRVVALEVHNLAAFQNAYRCDTEHLDANNLFARHFRDIVGDAPVAVVSPDPGGVKRADLFRETLERALERPVAGGFMEKHRSGGKVSGDIFAADVAGKTAIVIDDLISTGGTMARVAAACRANGAVRVYLAATHAVFHAGAGKTLAGAPVDGIVVTDSVAPRPEAVAALGERLQVLSVAHLLAEAIARCHDGGSIVDLLAG